MHVTYSADLGKLIMTDKTRQRERPRAQEPGGDWNAGKCGKRSGRLYETAEMGNAESGHHQQTKKTNTRILSSSAGTTLAAPKIPHSLILKDHLF